MVPMVDGAVFQSSLDLYKENFSMVRWCQEVRILCMARIELLLRGLERSDLTNSQVG